MFGKAFKGELGLAATFWKFGVLGISIYTVFVMFFAKISKVVRFMFFLPEIFILYIQINLVSCGHFVIIQ